MMAVTLQTLEAACHETHTRNNYLPLLLVNKEIIACLCGRCEAYSSQVVSLQEQMAQLEATMTQVTDERDKAQTALKRLTDEVKAKEEQWASESQVS